MVERFWFGSAADTADVIGVRAGCGPHNGYLWTVPCASMEWCDEVTDEVPPEWCSLEVAVSWCEASGSDCASDVRWARYLEGDGSLGSAADCPGDMSAIEHPLVGTPK